MRLSSVALLRVGKWNVQSPGSRSEIHTIAKCFDQGGNARKVLNNGSLFRGCLFGHHVAAPREERYLSFAFLNLRRNIHSNASAFAVSSRIGRNVSERIARCNVVDKPIERS